MRATDLLRLDHRALDKLFADYEVIGNFPEEMREIYEKIRSELELHSAIEEQVFYPAVRDAQSADSAYPVSAALVDHQRVKELLGELSTLDPAEDEFEDRMSELRQGVERHFREEEREMFAEVDGRLSEERMNELGTKMIELRSSLAKNPRYRKTA